MDKNFFFSFLLLTLFYFFIPTTNTLITAIGALIFILQLSRTLSLLIVHSKYLPQLYVPSTNRLVLITGCDSGFGLKLAKRLDYYGFHVLAGVLSKESDGCQYLEKYGSKRMRTVKLDVTKQDDVNEVQDLVAFLTNYKPLLEKLNEKQKNLPIFDRKFQKPIFGNVDGDLSLWAIVNNAGVAQFTPFEFGELEHDFKQIFDVNLFGVIRMTKAFLPFLRQSQGRIVNVGSISGRWTSGGLIAYSMTKHSVRSLTDGLRQELEKFDIKPILIEPTLYKTPISNIDTMKNSFDRCCERTDQHVLDDYQNEKYKKKFISYLEHTIRFARENIDEVVDCMEDAIINSRPRNQYWCTGTLQKILFWIVDQVSVETIDKILKMKPPKFLYNLMRIINNKS